MIRTLPTNLSRCFLLLCVIFFITTDLSAQLIIGKPSLSFTQICANPSFKNFQLSFNFSPSTELTATNQFIVELSDPSGNFGTNPTVVYTSAIGEITASPGNITFSPPVNTAGENYKIRIKSTSPSATSQNSNIFSAYYKPQDTQFTINNNIPTATYCASGSFVLTIDNPGTGLNDSPLKYPSLTYNWFKDNGLVLPPTKVASATGGSYSVTQPGVYYVETNYGTCTSDSYSNRVTVSESSTNVSTTISSSLGNPFCPSAGATTLSTTSGVSYKWSKDGTVISGATSQTYDTTTSGLYTVEVNFGGCSANASINLQSDGFKADIDPKGTSYIDIESGGTLDVTITTDAVDPSYKWYLNGTVITNAVSNIYSVKAVGNYKAEVTQTTGCVSTKDFTFQISDSNLKILNIPNIISLSSDQYNTWDIPADYKNADTNVMIVSSQGEVMFNGVDYNPSKWEIKDFKNVNPVYYYIITKGGDEKKGSITVIK
ncbi:gliding motility-associated C-terminal domain-containing protein [Flavobacterium sp. LS1R49]|uniref:Gliding motility-associated C-terminal domain-containing protein n=1 Tax=Flavobacterium shii TaxID=2987687 RepID=A0A9X2YX27_9FLAO|nr:gliding motility-associated C-terminal domain-containing protein [Flavobacterium shii]MCV9929659.1 gliding motility-associated C-terminal domain-containing protein [Flavobacterium shii]